MLTDVVCNLCGGNHYKVLYSYKKQDVKPYLITEASLDRPKKIVKCLRCGLVYVNERLDDFEIIRFYREMVDSDYIKEEKGRRQSANIILKRLSKLIKNQSPRILEIGCAAGFLLDEAKKKGWEVYGAELSEWACKYAKDRFGIDVFCGNIEGVGFESGSFDAVILADAIEHLLNPKKTLMEVRRILKPEGILFINTPDMDSLVSRLLNAKWWGINQFHIYYFTKKTLNELLTSAGFKIMKWSGYPRTFTFSYWFARLTGYSSFFKPFAFLQKIPFIAKSLLTIDTSDQIAVFARKRRSIVDLQDIEKAGLKDAERHKKVVVVLPAYNASKTLELTVKDIPKDIVDEIILVDDASTDNTVEIAEKLGLIVFKHDRNKGYGGNQKTCYINALERGADIIIMVHPDYQYDPKVIPELVRPILEGRADAVFGSRMLKGGALEGGMPLWKHNANIILTAIENVTLGTYLSEYHSGFRAYSREVLGRIRFQDNSDNFVFDTEIIVQVILNYFRVDEIPIRTRYFEEASVISFKAGLWYGLGILGTLFKVFLHKNNIIRFKQFE